MHHLYISDHKGSFEFSTLIRLEPTETEYLFQLLYDAHRHGLLTRHTFID